MLRINSGTAAGALEFLDNLVVKGRATSGAVQALKSAFKQVMFVVDGDKWEEVVVKDIDVEDHISRFSTLTNGKYHKDSLVTYKSRVNKVIDWYTRFLSEPGWAPPRGKSKISKIHVKDTSVVKTTTNEERKQDTVTPPEKTESVLEDFLMHQFPLREKTDAKLYLPRDLKKREAKRLAVFIESLCLDVEE